MIRIKEILRPENILVDFNALSREDAILQVTQTFLKDSRVKVWEDFYEQLRERDASMKVNLQFGLTLPHTRTVALQDMVMGFGRLLTPLITADGSIQFIMVIGIPETMDSEYLRLVGILMRVFRNDWLRGRLKKAETPAEVIHVFTLGEK
jgi:mannitol/fructose-specific phosphotransferase system IIA component (Ntr-type)